MCQQVSKKQFRAGNMLPESTGGPVAIVNEHHNRMWCLGAGMLER